MTKKGSIGSVDPSNESADVWTKDGLGNPDGPYQLHFSKGRVVQTALPNLDFTTGNDRPTERPVPRDEVIFDLDRQGRVAVWVFYRDYRAKLPP